MLSMTSNAAVSPIILLMGAILTVRFRPPHISLRILRGAGAEGLPCSEIGERMITRDPDITRLLDRLQTRGLVDRSRGKQDRRVIYGKITPAGLKLLREMDGPVQKHGQEMLKHVSQQKLRQLIDLLEQVR